MAKKIAGITIELDAETSKLVKGLDTVSAKADSISTTLSGIGTSLTKYVTVPIAGVAAASVKSFGEVDDAMDIVVKKTGATGDELNSMQESVSNIAKTIPTSFESAGNAIGEVNTRFGLTGDELETLSTQFIKFADLNDTDVSDSIDTVQTALDAFGLGAKDAGKLLDTMNAVGQDTGISMDELGSLMVTNATAFQGLGLNAADAAKLLGTLETSGVDTSTVMQGLTRVQKEAMESGTSMEDALTEALSSTGSAIDIFGAKSGPKLYESFQNGTLSVEDFVTSTSSLDDALGNVETTFDNTLDPMDQMQTITNTLKDTGYEIVQSAGPMLVDILGRISDAVSSLAEWWGSLDDDQKENIITAAGIVAAIGPVIAIIGSLVGVISTVTTVIGGAATVIGFLTSPVGLVIAAIGALIAIGITLYKHWDDIKEGCQQLAKVFSKVWGDIKNKVTETWNNIKQKTTETFNNIKDKITNSQIGQAVGKVWDAAKTTMSNSLNAMKQAYDSHGGGLKGAVAATMEGIKQYYSLGFNFLDNLTGGKLSEMASTIQNKFSDFKNTISNAWDNIKNTTSQTWNDIKNKVDENGGGIEGVIRTVAEGAENIWDTAWQQMDDATGGALSGIWDTVDSTFDWIEDKIDSAMDFIRGLFDGEIDFPHINVPHINIDGGQSPWGIGGRGYPPSIDIDWYKKAMDNAYMLNGATIFGANKNGLMGGGESGSEMIIGTNKLLDMIAQAKGGETTINNQFVINGIDRDPQDLAKEISYYLDMELQRTQGAFA